MIRVELTDQSPMVTFYQVPEESLPDRLQPYITPKTKMLKRLRHDIEQGVITQVWERIEALSPKHVAMHRFTLRFPAEAL